MVIYMGMSCFAIPKLFFIFLTLYFTLFGQMINCANQFEAFAVNSTEISVTGLTAIEDHELSNFTSLTKFDAFNNAIASVGDLAFSGTQLEILGLGRNRLTMFPNVSVVGRTLKDIRLELNQITLIPAGHLAGLVVIEHLSLFRNRLNSVGTLVELQGKPLKSINLGVNTLMDFPEDLLQHLPNIERVELGYTGVPFPNVRGLVLDTLALEANNILHIPEYLLQNASIAELSFEGNLLTSFPDPRDLNLNISSFFNLKGNTLNCDQSLGWIKDAEEAGWLHVNLDAKPCASPPQLVNTPWTSINASQLNSTGGLASCVAANQDPYLHQWRYSPVFIPWRGASHVMKLRSVVQCASVCLYPACKAFFYPSNSGTCYIHLKGSSLDYDTDGISGLWYQHVC